MKRSEMIALIEKKFITSDICDDISELLDFLESKGMLPPAYEKFQEAPVLTMYLKVKVNEWEPEDEKK